MSHHIRNSRSRPMSPHEMVATENLAKQLYGKGLGAWGSVLRAYEFGCR